MADENPFRFSTKYLDSATNLYYYGYRYYFPELGRWLNRDPIGEQGGLNLYGFVLNDPVLGFDALGFYLWTSEENARGWIGDGFKFCRDSQGQDSHTNIK